MVGRSSVSSLLLILAALALASPAAAEPAPLLLPLLLFRAPAQPAPLTAAAVAASASSAAGGIEITAPASLTQDFSTAAASTGAPTPSSTSSDATAADDSGAVDPTETISPPAVATSPGSRPPALAARLAQASDSGELGVEYQLSVRDAASFLDRLSARFKRLVEQAMTYLGTPYRLGGTTRRGLDCSGLVGVVYGEQGLDLPRTAAQQFAEGVAVATGDLRAGDLVFFRDTYKRGISHVGIYVGDGRFLHAAGRRHGVIVSELARPYYRSRYAGARRPATEPPAADRQAFQASPTSQTSQGGAELAGNATAASTLAAAPR